MFATIFFVEEEPKAIPLDPRDYLIDRFVPLGSSKDKEQKKHNREAQNEKLKKYVGKPIQFTGELIAFREDLEKKIYFFELMGEWKEERGELDAISHPTKGLFFYVDGSSRPLKEEMVKNRGNTIILTIQSEVWQYRESSYIDSELQDNNEWAIFCEKTKIIEKKLS